jgi:hypothetical protein
VLYCEFPERDDDEAALARSRAAAWSAGLTTPRILMPGEEGEIDRIVALRPEAVLVRTLAFARALRALAPHLLLVGDDALNAANELAAGV